MAQGKRHWAPDPQKQPFRLPCGVIGYGTQFGVGADWSHQTAQHLVAAANQDPDWYCVKCLWKARLALAKESAPKPSDVVWPKPRPIAEAPRTTILAWFPGTDMFNEGWEIVFPSNEGWSTGREGHQPTHFLPLPPEVR